MSDDMIERVAQAIYDAENGIDGDQLADMIYEDDRIDGRDAAECRAQVMVVCRHAARAAIAAMREPTEAMIAAGVDVWCNLPGTDEEQVKAFWQAMIDAALKSHAKPA